MGCESCTKHFTWHRYQQHTHRRQPALAAVPESGAGDRDGQQPDDGDGLQDGTELGDTTPVPDPDGAGPAEGTDLGVFIPDADAGATVHPGQRAAKVEALAGGFGIARTPVAIEEAGADFIHIDVMDGQFVPNITVGVPVVASLRRYSRLPFDVHLMVREPDHLLDAFVDAGADILGVQETKAHPDQLNDDLREPEGYHTYWASAEKKGYSGPAKSLVAGGDPAAAASAAGISAERLTEVAGWIAAGPSVILPGGVSTAADPTNLAIATLLLNEVAGNVGKTVTFGDVARPDQMVEGYQVEDIVQEACEAVFRLDEALARRVLAPRLSHRRPAGPGAGPPAARRARGSA